MTEVVELLSGGNLILMLMLVAVVSLVLGMGLPLLDFARGFTPVVGQVTRLIDTPRLRGGRGAAAVRGQPPGSAERINAPSAALAFGKRSRDRSRYR